MAQPDPRLKVLNKLVGTWDLVHKDLKTGETWRGRDVFEWLDDGYFMSQRHEEFGIVKGINIIGYEIRLGEDKPSADLIANWFETNAGHHFVYVWHVDEKNLIYWLDRKYSDDAFKGVFNQDSTEVKGTWKWFAGGYELTMRKVR